MVSPGNPLKSREGLPPLAERIAAARKIMRDPRIKVTGFEAEHRRASIPARPSISCAAPVRA